MVIVGGGDTPACVMVGSRNEDGRVPPSVLNRDADIAFQKEHVIHFFFFSFFFPSDAVQPR